MQRQKKSQKIQRQRKVTSQTTFVFLSSSSKLRFLTKNLDNTDFMNDTNKEIPKSLTKYFASFTLNRSIHEKPWRDLNSMCAIFQRTQHHKRNGILQFDWKSKESVLFPFENVH